MKQINDLNRIAVALEKMVIIFALGLEESGNLSKDYEQRKKDIQQILRKNIAEHNKMVRESNE